MSHRDEDNHSTSHLDEDEEFVDLNDPTLEIADDDGAPVPEDDNDDVAADDATQDGDEDDGVPQGIEPTEKEPERQDAIAFVQAPQPLHAVSVCDTFAAFGCENDTAIVVPVLPDEEVGAALQGEAAVPPNTEMPIAHTLEGHTDTVTHIAFSPNGKTLATGSMDCTVKLWDATNNFELTHTLMDLSGEVECLLWHPSSLVIVAGGADAQAVLWNAAKGTAAQWFSAHRGSVLCAQWTQDVKKLVTGSGDGSVAVFNPKTGVAEQHYNKDLSPEGAGVCAIALLSADAILAGCEDGTLHVISMARQKVAHKLPEVHTQAIESIALNPTLGLFVTGACDCNIAVWSVTDLIVRNQFRIAEGITSVCWGGPSGAWVFCGCTDGDVRFWDGRTGDGRVVRAIGHRRTVLGMHVGKDRIVTASDDGTGRVFSAQACAKAKAIADRAPLPPAPPVEAPKRPAPVEEPSSSSEDEPQYEDDDDY